MTANNLDSKSSPPHYQWKQSYSVIFWGPMPKIGFESKGRITHIFYCSRIYKVMNHRKAIFNYSCHIKSFSFLSSWCLFSPKFKLVFLWRLIGRLSHSNWECGIGVQSLSHIWCLITRQHDYLTGIRDRAYECWKRFLNIRNGLSSSSLVAVFRVLP